MHFWLIPIVIIELVFFLVDTISLSVEFSGVILEEHVILVDLDFDVVKAANGSLPAVI